MAQLSAPQPRQRIIINDPNSPSFDPNKFTIEVLPDGSERIVAVNNVDPGLFLIQPLGGAAQEAMPSTEDMGPASPVAPPVAPPDMTQQPQPVVTAPAIPQAPPAGPPEVIPQQTQAEPVLTDQVIPPNVVAPTAAAAPPVPPIAPEASPPPKRTPPRRKTGKTARRAPSYTLGHGPRL